MCQGENKLSVYSIIGCCYSSQSLLSHQYLCTCPQVLRISSLTKEGIPKLWDTIQDYRERMLEAGEMDRRRRSQVKVWMWNHIQDNITQLFREHPAVQARLPDLEQAVASGRTTPGHAADILLQEFQTRS